ncbi:PAS domain-containing protein [Kineococcus xinjiangensis]|uniref:PAS domain-containing protein n=1 Tax=Kineococcus xinjiangensis TaxID=512762 RepID=A0A2S6IUL6_9ACTN|nr:SpoIIE family protein phosphatase [Kineococcus xinjiangensis]PPK97967.1 PAS domain-containing protein [Kineococcus xinjiangensis]
MDGTTGEAASPGNDPVGDDLAAALRAFDEAPGFWWVFAGPEHRIVAANAGARALSPRADLIGLTAREAHPEIEGQNLFGLLDDTLRSGTPSTAEEFRVQIDSDGDGTLEEHVLSWTVAPWHGRDGTRRGVMALGADVTAAVRARQRAEDDAAVTGARYRRTLDVVAELQRALLPPSLPVLPCVDLAARYLVAGEEQAAGGDWYDAVVLDSGRVALVVGDVVGHGLAAASTMSRLGAVLAERLHAGAPPAEALAALDGAARRIPGAAGTTVCVAVLDAPTGRLEYCTRGHPPPLVVAAGRGRYLPGTGGGTLGSGRPGAVGTAELDPGDVLVLFTDGLVERPGVARGDSLAELARVAVDVVAGRALPVGAPGSAAQRVCGQVVELLTRRGYGDDVTVLAAQVRDRVPPLRLDLPAAPASLPLARDELRWWLTHLGCSEEDVLAVGLGVSEALANSVVHAYRGRAPGRVRVVAELADDGCLRVGVADDGRWRSPSPLPGDSGRGLGMLAEVGSGPFVERSETGTTVSFARRVRHPRTAAAAPPGRAAPPVAGAALRVVAARDAVHVRGAVEEGCAERLRLELLHACRGGAVDLVLDLREVTHLASAGVRVLEDLLTLTGAGDRSLRLVAPTGSAAAFVLDLVELPRLEALPSDGS